MTLKFLHLSKLNHTATLNRTVFINCCVSLETLYSPHELHEVTSQAEQNADRKRLIHWGPRTLDVDIVLFDDLVMHDETLTIPHIDMANREFVLKPLAELDPYAVNPALGKTAAALLADLKKS
ncbi:2-amino-4-hydroxy-6-hydroxymethyldihydropteridine diphosphokinase [Ruminococcus sp. HUN007]|uniref:2-amino-4-hydroxy-6- hydroxymethyldihydropteridine diphosphokinase n=1 Tax=Ruminococcus sp. HUN007 TaxID=1514668 RepID=UPI00325B26AD